MKSSYERKNSQTEKFELVMGVNAGYFHNNKTSLSFESIYQEIAKKSFWKWRNIYICIYIIKDTCNPAFAELDKYKKTVRVIAKFLAEKLSQSTFTLTWSKINLTYFTKKSKKSY